MPIPGIVASGISGHLTAPSSFYSIATATVTSGGTASITFSSIPSTYTHLQIRGIGRSDNTLEAYGKMTFNGVTASGNYYALHQLYGEGTTATAGIDSNSTYQQTGYFATANQTSGIMGAMVLDILDYRNGNKYVTSRNISGYDANGSGYILLRSSLSLNSTAITSITLTVSNGNWAQYSSFALYGVK